MTISMATLMSVLSLIIAIGAAVKVLYSAKKWLEKPLDEINKKLKEHEEYLENDKKRLEEISKALDDLTEAINMLIKSNLTMMEHLEEGNHSGEIRAEKKALNDWLIDSRNK